MATPSRARQKNLKAEHGRHRTEKGARTDERHAAKSNEAQRGKTLIKQTEAENAKNAAWRNQRGRHGLPAGRRGSYKERGGEQGCRLQRAAARERERGEWMMGGEGGKMQDAGQRGESLRTERERERGGGGGAAHLPNFKLARLG